MAIAWTDTLGDIDWDELSALFKVALGEKPAAVLKTVFGNSRYCCFARDNGRLVGVGSALADAKIGQLGNCPRSQQNVVRLQSP